MSLDKYTDADLKHELIARKSRKEDPVPQPKEDIDYSGLLNLVRLNIRSIVNTGSPLKDHKQYIFETAMTCIYGDKIWNWWNEHNKGEV